MSIPSSNTGFGDGLSGARKILTPSGMVMLRICLPVQSDLRLRLDDGGSRDSPVPLRNPKQDVLHLVPVQEAISKGELANFAEGILYDAHDRLIGLRRYDLLRGLDKSYLEGVGTYLSRDPCNLAQLR